MEPTPPVAVDEEAAPDGAALVLRWHGRPAARGRLRVVGDEARLEVEVDAEHRGLGLGKMLLGALEARARERGARAAVVRVDDASPYAAALRRSGWRRAGEGAYTRELSDG